MYQCSSCLNCFRDFSNRCPDCKGWRCLVWIEGDYPREAEGELTLVPLNGEIPKRVKRVSVGQSDASLGGGLVPAKVYLLGGEPGVGKSTLLLQWLDMVKGNSLYASAEESVTDVMERAVRINLDGSNVLVTGTDDLESIGAAAEIMHPVILLIDSLQTMQLYSEDYTSGTNQHVMLVGEYIAELKKRLPDTVIIVVSHVNSEGGISGPTALDHLVDTVLYLKHGKEENQRTLYASKSRTGPAFISTLFEMSACGLRVIR